MLTFRHTGRLEPQQLAPRWPYADNCMFMCCLFVMCICLIDSHVCFVFVYVLTTVRLMNGADGKVPCVGVWACALPRCVNCAGFFATCEKQAGMFTYMFDNRTRMLVVLFVWFNDCLTHLHCPMESTHNAASAKNVNSLVFQARASNPKKKYNVLT